MLWSFKLYVLIIDTRRTYAQTKTFRLCQVVSETHKMFLNIYIYIYIFIYIWYQSEKYWQTYITTFLSHRYHMFRYILWKIVSSGFFFSSFCIESSLSFHRNSSFGVKCLPIWIINHTVLKSEFFASSTLPSSRFQIYVARHLRYRHLCLISFFLSFLTF